MSLLLYVLYNRIDHEQLRAQLGDIKWGWVAAFWGFLLVNTALSTWKWRFLLIADGIRVRFSSLFASYWIGSFFNVFLPSTIGGDAYRIADIGRRSTSTARTAASVMVDRLLGFLALAFYGLFLYPFFKRTYDADPRLFMLPAAALFVLILTGLVLWEGEWLRRVIRLLPTVAGNRAEGVLDSILNSVRVYGRRRRTAVYVFLLSLLFQFFAITAVYCLGKSVGINLPLYAYGFFIPFISLMEMIPVSIFGIGLRDVGYVWFMLSVGHTRADAATFSVLYVAATVVYIAIGGLMFLLRSSPEHRDGHDPRKNNCSNSSTTLSESENRRSETNTL